MTSPSENYTLPLPAKRRCPNPDGRTPMDLTGQRFGRLVVLNLHHREYGKYFWNTQCDCGNTHVAQTVLLRGGNVKSCGCLKKENKQRLTHGHTCGRKGTRTYKSWSGMMTRCYTPSTTRYKDWGGRGIKVCERWHSFEKFLADMGECPEGKSIDRIDNNGNYEPGNCKWSTPLEQGQNKRPYRKQHQCVCVICGAIFMAVLSRSMYCKTECYDEGQRRSRAKKKTGGL